MRLANKTVLIFAFICLIIPVTGHSYSDLKTSYIKTQSGQTIDLMIDVAITPQDQQQGLMNRQTIPKDYGMLFYASKAKIWRMWMKNTYIPLDMLFLNHNGEIIHILENTEPLSETVIGYDKPAQAVLEVYGGFVAKNAVKTGDRLHHEIFSTTPLH